MQPSQTGADMDGAPDTRFSPAPDYTGPQPRMVGMVNWVGLWTHYWKEVHRFFKVGFQTLVAPIVTTLLFLAIFSLALGRGDTLVAGVSFDVFLAPGLIIMAVIQNAFANTSTSVMIAKVQGNIVDVLMPPLSTAELAIGYVMGGVTRGVVVGVTVAAAMAIFVPIGIANIWVALFHIVAASMLLSLLGVITGIWAEKFDHIASITNFVVMPLSFLSGTFYSIDRLPEPWYQLAFYNPFFYMIDGFRYGFIGRSDAPLMVGIVLMVVLNLGLWTLCHRMFATGYKLKA